MTKSHNDSELINRAQSGDANALAILHDRHWQAVFTYIYFRVSDQLTAEDLTADVFVRMVSAIDRYQDRGKTILPWLYTVARNLIADHYRKIDKQPSFLPLKENMVTAQENPENLLSRQLGVDCLKQALHYLTAIQQQVIIGKFIEGRSNREVAELTDRTEGAIKSLQHRALAALRRAIEKEGCYEL